LGFEYKGLGPGQGQRRDFGRLRRQGHGGQQAQTGHSARQYGSEVAQGAKDRVLHRIWAKEENDFFCVLLAASHYAKAQFATRG
jgi:hypothetical protein